MADAPTSTDQTATIIIGTVIAATVLWYVSFFSYNYWSSHRSKGARGNRRNKQSKRDQFRSENRRVHELMMDSARVATYFLTTAVRKNVTDHMASDSRRRLVTSYRVMALCLKEIHVDLLDMGGIKRLHTGVVKLSKDARKLFDAVSDLEDIRHEIRHAVQGKGMQDIEEAVQECNRLADLIQASSERLGTLVSSRVKDWTLGSEEYLEFQAWAMSHVGFKDVSFTRVDRMGLHEEDDDDASTYADSGASTGLWARFKALLPDAFLAHPYFYFLFFGVYFAIFVSFLPAINDDELNRRTFLSLPPQYQLADAPLERIFVPIIYGIMHTVLYCLGILPTAMTRGFHRDIVRLMPRIRELIPYDDMVFFHRLVGYLAIGGLTVVACIWLVVMGLSCNVDGVTDTPEAQAAACLAFNPNIFDATQESIDELEFDSIPGGSYFDPRDNVLFLRQVVWFLWLFCMPLIGWANVVPTTKLLPTWLKRNFYEFVFYIHVVGAYATVVAALYARFEVFYPIILSWAPYFLDLLRERLWYTTKAHIIVDARPGQPTSLSHESSSDQQPTLLSLTISQPRRFMHGAGQWMYLKVPSIDGVWHPFSLASSSADQHIHLHIGIRGQWAEKRRSNGQWVQPAESATWTYKLLEKFREKARTSAHHQSKESIRCLVRGSYGSPFTKCFQRKYPAVVIIGAGTGLTSALSVLKEMIYRHITGKSTQYVWFVWSCRRVDDLLWCWATLQSSLYDACRRGAIELDEDWRPLSSAMLDWLSVTIYITRSDSRQLMQFLHLEEGLGSKEDTVEYDKADTIKPKERVFSGDLVSMEVPPMLDFEEEEEMEYEQRIEDIAQAVHVDAATPRRNSKDAVGNGSATPGNGTPATTTLFDLMSEFEEEQQQKHPGDHHFHHLDPAAVAAAGQITPGSPATTTNKAADNSTEAVRSPRPNLFAMLAATDATRKFAASRSNTVNEEAEDGMGFGNDGDNTILSPASPGSPGLPAAVRERQEARSVHFANSSKIAHLSRKAKTAQSMWTRKSRRATVKPALRREQTTAVKRRPSKDATSSLAWVAEETELDASAIDKVAELASMHGPLTASAQLEEPLYDYAEEESPELYDWMFGEITPKLAEAVLNYRSRGVAGDFLVRYERSGEAVLSVLVDPAKPEFEHLDLRQDGTTNEFTVGDRRLSEPCFSIVEVIDHLLQKPEGVSVKLVQTPHKHIDLEEIEARTHHLDFTPKAGVTIDAQNPLFTLPRKRHRRSGGVRRNDINTDQLSEAVQERIFANREHSIHQWLKAQILETSLDGESAHISRLLAWVREFVANPSNGVYDGRHQPIALCFCGPPPVAHLIGKAAEGFGAHMEFSSESQ